MRCFEAYAWPSADRRSRLVVIARDLDGPLLRGWLKPDSLADISG